MKTFDILAKRIAEITGSAPIFMVAFLMILIWFVSGFLFEVWLSIWIPVEWTK